MLIWITQKMSMILVSHVHEQLIWSSSHFFDFIIRQLIVALTILITWIVFFPWDVLHSSCFICVLCHLRTIMIIYRRHPLFFHTHFAYHPGASLFILWCLLRKSIVRKKLWIWTLNKRKKTWKTGYHRFVVSSLRFYGPTIFPHCNSNFP